jgi:hypothetical protein
MSAAIYVADCRFGRGVFAGTLIRKDEEILRFAGALINLEAALAKGERQCDPLQLGPEIYLDIGEPGVLVNHSCEPNAGIREDFILVALADIHPGEEIFYDYSTTMSEKCWTLACGCASRECRGTVGDFDALPATRRHRYLDLGIVQKYIARRFVPARAQTAESHRQMEPGLQPQPAPPPHRPAAGSLNPIPV